ncbi:MAG: Rap1a/Tai family immunity protein [Methylococcales bacterium]|nr:Rap1a/Tai family immunity protein [Methylococcales bacterium]
MKRKLLSFIAMLGILLPGLASSAVTEDDFKAKTTRNLINLCTVSPQDKHYEQAIHFCHGYLVGAYQYSLAESLDDPNKSLVCFPEPKPTRNEAIALFVAWTQKHPQFMSEMPVETEFRFLTEKWPCKK